MAKTTIRGIRIPDELWAQAQAKAESEGRSVSDVLRTYLERWVRR